MVRVTVTTSDPTLMPTALTVQVAEVLRRLRVMVGPLITNSTGHWFSTLPEESVNIKPMSPPAMGCESPAFWNVKVVVMGAPACSVQVIGGGADVDARGPMSALSVVAAAPGADSCLIGALSVARAKNFRWAAGKSFWQI
jgi:hypothetical protein